MGGVPEKKHVKFFLVDCLFYKEYMHFLQGIPRHLAVKNELMDLGGLAYLVHVSSHTDVFDNKRVDIFSKKGISLDVTKPQLSLKKSILKMV